MIDEYRVFFLCVGRKICQEAFQLRGFFLNDGKYRSPLCPDRVRRIGLRSREKHEAIQDDQKKESTQERERQKGEPVFSLNSLQEGGEEEGAQKYKRRECMDDVEKIRPCP